MPVLCETVNALDFWGEVVSGIEYEIAKSHIPANRLIFNGPCKTRGQIGLALDEGAMVNLDSFAEIDLLAELAGSYDAVKIGLRANFDIGEGTSRFGFSFENGDFARAAGRIRDIGNVRINSIHSHFTTKTRSLDLFSRRMDGMLTVFESLRELEDIEHLNIGGGFFGPMSDVARKQFPGPIPTFDEYATVIAGRLRDAFGTDGPWLIVEPGVSMVADAMDYVVRVLDQRTVGDQEYLTVDGSINSLYPTGSRYRPDYAVICLEEGEMRPCHVVGNTCMEHDILLSDIETGAARGDFFVFHNRGAYSNVYKPPFIREAPPIIGVNGEVFADRQTAAQITAQYRKVRGHERSA
jgi:diaminopimelate decarboxylase